MTLHIISGKFKGRSIKFPKGNQTRPTTGMVRKAIFDILQTEIHNITLLDVFAGSGAIGLEALSLGAKEVVFIENHKQVLPTLAQNIASFHLENSTTIYRLDALQALEKLEKQKKIFDIIYIDPPYNQSNLYQKILTHLNQSSLLTKTGSIFVETSSELSLPDWNNLVLIKKRHFGSTALYQYRLSSNLEY